MALSSCRTACLASGGCSGDSMSSTAFHTASTACWGTRAHTDIDKHRRKHVLLYQKYHIADSPPQTFLFWQDHIHGSSCEPGCSDRNPGGAPDKKNKNPRPWRDAKHDMKKISNEWWVCVYEHAQRSLLRTLMMSVVMMNSDCLDSLCLLGGRGGPSPKIPFTLSLRLSLLGCLFMAQPGGVTNYTGLDWWLPGERITYI